MGGIFFITLYNCRNLGEFDKIPIHSDYARLLKI